MNPLLPDTAVSNLGTPPLYELYQAVKACDRQTAHATVDIQSYFLLLETLLKGYMITSPDELILLCEKLWLKPYHRQGVYLNRDILASLIHEKLEASFKPADPTATALPVTTNTPKQSNATTPPATPPVNPGTSKTPPSKADVELTKQAGELNLYLADNASESSTTATGTDEHASKFLQKTYLTKGLYLPVNPRRLAQSIRSYRFAVKGQRKTAVDMEATINRIAKTNFFDHFEYKSHEQFTTDWTLLIDTSSSMAAFYPLCNAIVRMITESATNRGAVFYFKNQPTTHLFYDQLQTRSILWPHFVTHRKMNILILSDAGAARGTYNEERIVAVLKMLRQLKQHNVAWLNPMPRARWKKTSAEMIAEFVDMFEPGEGDNDGVATIVRLFKSKIRMAKTE